MTARRSARAEEVLEHAMRLFADRGYGATSVADIQEAAGMTPGSGALYKHFPSKEALLEAGIQEFIDEIHTAPVELPPLEAGRLREILQAVGHGVLHRLSANQDGFRIAWRDLEPFPELRQRVVDQRIQPGFGRIIAWLQQGVDAGQVELKDPLATAAVLLSSLIYFRLMQVLLGEPPAQLDDERFIDAWVELAITALTTPS
jgi:AcrR family transcriptional regulator